MNAGCKVVAITDINKVKLEEVQAELLELNNDAIILTAVGDIADERFVNAFINSVVSEAGRVDYAVRLPPGT